MTEERWCWCGNCRLVLTPPEARSHWRTLGYPHLPHGLRHTLNDLWRDMRAEQRPVEAKA